MLNNLNNQPSLKVLHQLPGLWRGGNTLCPINEVTLRWAG